MKSVGLALDSDFAAALPADPESTMRLAITYRGPVQAPIAKGDPIARLQLQDANGTVVLNAPLVATADVARAGLFRRIGNAFAKWFG